MEISQVPSAYPSTQSLGSASSLSIQDIIKASLSDCSNILSVSLSFTSRGSLYSLGEVPLFGDLPSGRPHATKFAAMPILSTADPFQGSRHLVTVPTSKRVKSMLMEPICVSKWAERASLDPPPNHLPWEDAAIDDRPPLCPTWIPEGSLFSPDTLHAILQHSRAASRNFSSSNASELSAELLLLSIDTPNRSGPILDENRIGCTSSQVLEHNTESPRPEMPSIMVSTSTAVVPISLESSQCLVPPTPLAIRRGNQLPTSLFLSPLDSVTTKKRAEANVDLGLYPEIPTSFLGSEASEHSTSFDYPIDDAAVSMDLDTMCENLRSLCPPLRTPDFPPPLYSLPPVPPSCAASPKSDDSIGHNSDIPFIHSGSDEWAVVDSYLSEFADQHSSEQVLEDEPQNLTQPLRPVQRVPPGKSVADGSSIPWTDSPTLDAHSPGVFTQDPATPQRTSADSSKQQRRKTVIIETSDGNDRRRTRLTLDLSDLVDHEEGLCEEPMPVPWEPSPPSHFSFSPQSLASDSPTAYGRPASSATLKPPARGILKMKIQKNVRFSIIPSMHEYDDSEAQSEVADTSALEHQRSPTPPPGGGRKHIRCSAPHLVAATKDLKANPENRTSSPKHPAVRTMTKQAKQISASTSSVAPTAVLSVPKTPKSPKDASSLHRSPLSALNGCQNQLTATSIATPSDRGRASPLEVTKPKRPRTAALSMPPQTRRSVQNSPRPVTVQDVKTLLRSSPEKSASPSKSSRVPVPFRSMWTKLRA